MPDASRSCSAAVAAAAPRSSCGSRIELGQDDSQYLNIAAAATTPERCLSAVLAASRLSAPDGLPDATSTKAAVDALFAYFDGAVGATTRPAFLLDEFLDLRTFESFPGLRHVQRDLVARLAASPSRFVLASRFTARVHRLLRDAPARFEVVHVPPLDVQDVERMAQRVDGDRQDWAATVAPAVAALSAGVPVAAHLLLTGLATMGPATDAVAALAAAIAPDGALTARCRECYELRLHRARGYGALKAILGVLADTEPLNLTEISHVLQRTPGSTKDYLSWLEDVDLITMRGKRYAFTDPLLRLYVRLYGRPGPPTDDDIVREVGAFTKARLPLATPPAAPAPVSPRPSQRAVEPSPTSSGIIEID